MSDVDASNAYMRSSYPFRLCTSRQAGFQRGRVQVMISIQTVDVM